MYHFKWPNQNEEIRTMTHLNDITTDTNVSTRSKGSHLTIDDRVKISVLKELEY